VGRSKVQAYAYFLIPPVETLSEEARRRITAIEELNYLGAGLHLAMRDLEIRGAGNLLGKQQSGHIHALGFDLYMRMLQEEIDHLQGRPHETVPEPEIDAKVDAYIPDDYIQDITQKVNIYRRFYQTETEEEVQDLLEELKDRFGPVPEEVMAYGEVMRLRALAKALRIRSITFLKETVKVHLYSPQAIEPERLMKLLKDRHLRFSPEGFSFKVSSSGKDAIVEVRQFMRALQAGEATASIHAPR
jgi:transcription-repair coupling factor (superfamily II helicase)